MNILLPSGRKSPGGKDLLIICAEREFLLCSNLTLLSLVNPMTSFFIDGFPDCVLLLVLGVLASQLEVVVESIELWEIVRQ